MTETESVRSVKLQRGIFMVWAVLLVLALFPLTADPVAPVKSLVTGAAVLLLACSGLAASLTREGGGACSRGMLLIAAFLAVNLASAALSGMPQASLHHLRWWVTLGLLAYYASQVYRTAEHAWGIIDTVCVAVGLSSVYGLLQTAGVDPFPWAVRNVEEYLGLPSTYGNPNFAGHALVIGLVLVTGAASRPGKRWLFLPMAIMATHFYLTHMRGGRVALVAALLTFLIAVTVRRLPLRNPWRPHVAMACLCVAAIAAGSLAAVALQTAPRVLVSGDSSLVLRLNAYLGAANVVEDRPLSGLGPGMYGVHEARYWTPYEQAWYASKGQRNVHVHNEVLETAAEGGVAAAALLILIFFFAIARSLSLAFDGGTVAQRRLGYTLASCLAAVFVDSLFGFNLRVPVSAGLLFLLLGIVEGNTPPAARRKGRGLRVALAGAGLVLAAVLFWSDTRAFRAEMLFQRAEGARFYAGQHAQSGALADAVRALERGQRLLPWDGRFPRALGSVAMLQRDLDLAVAHFAHAIALQPYDPGLLVALAEARINRALSVEDEDKDHAGDLGAVEPLATQALALCPVLGEAHLALGRVAVLRAERIENAGQDASVEFASARRHLTEALKDGTPDQARTLRLLAQVCLGLGLTDVAGEHLARSCALDPEDAATWRLFQSLEERHGGQRAYYDALSTAYAELDRRAKYAESTFTLVARRWVVLLADHMQDRETALLVASSALHNAPQDLGLWGVFARLHPPDETASAVKRVLDGLDEAALGPVPPLIGFAADITSQPEEELMAQAAQMANDAQIAGVSETPDLVDAKYSWFARGLIHVAGTVPLSGNVVATLRLHAAGIYVAAGRWAESLEALNDISDGLEVPEQASAMLYRSCADDGLGNPEQAYEYARRAVDLAPDSLIARWNLAQRLASLGRYQEARFEYLSLLPKLRRDPALLERMEEEMRAVQSQLDSLSTSRPLGGTE